ncbi:MAG: IS21 family transposase [Gammaproteobacteria bacterium]|nr:IS21 family transposase [Acidimicrobiaceae bacterium]MYD02795.1 IS21 family transposase [Gammaproteobacteria bacterium]
MVSVETIGKIRRAWHVHGRSIRSIAKSMGVSRNTVRKVLRSDGSAPKYRRSEQPHSKLGDFIPELERKLEANKGKKPRDRLSMKRIWRQLADEGCDASYSAVCRYAAAWDRRNGGGVSGAHVPLAFDPGEAFQFDWSHEWAVIGGTTMRLRVAHMRLCHSRMSYVRAYLRETQEMVFDAHNRAFEAFGGSCQRGIYDNMKTVVDVIFAGRTRKFNARFLEMCGHFLVEPVACTPNAAWEKGQVESQVRDVRERLFREPPRFDSLDDLNDWLEESCRRHAREHPHPEEPEMTVREVFACEERRCLIPFPGPFDGHRSLGRGVSKTCLVHFDGNRYSAEARASEQAAEVFAYADRVDVRVDGELVGSHPRSFARGKTVYDWLHYLPVLERKPGALRNGAPFRNGALPEALEAVRGRLGAFEDGDRQMVRILASISEDGLDEVCAACADALDGGAVSADVVLNILSRRRDPGPAPRIELPERFRLNVEPEADCSRYDSLREIPR